MCSMSQQLSLLAAGRRRVPELVGELERSDLGRGAWIDWQPQWLPGADEWMEHLRDRIAWRHAERPMYDRIVAVPRLMANFCRSDHDLPVELADLTDRFGEHYGQRFTTVGCNLYRDGNDSVAWHADRVRRPGNSIVAIIGVGARRPFLLRPITGGPSRRWLVGDGDLIVLGGTIQTDWQHAVPKMRHSGPRLSIMIRSGHRR